MKRLILHILLVIIISDITSLCQFFKIPSLIRHFIEHKELNHDITFMDFMSMHYWGEDLDDNDDEKDMQLPFKKIEVHHSTFLFIPFASTFTFKNTFWPIRSDYGPDKPQVHYLTTLGSLFRPPQV